MIVLTGCHPWMDGVWQAVQAVGAQGGGGELFWNVGDEGVT